MLCSWLLQLDTESGLLTQLSLFFTIPCYQAESYCFCSSSTAFFYISDFMSLVIQETCLHYARNLRYKNEEENVLSSKTLLSRRR